MFLFSILYIDYWLRISKDFKICDYILITMIDKLKSLLKTKKDIDFWDIRQQNVNSLSLSAWNSKTKDLTQSQLQAISLRVFQKNRMGFAATTINDPNKDMSDYLVEKAMKMSIFSQPSYLLQTKPITDSKKTVQKIKTNDISFKEKKDLILSESKNDNPNIKNKLVIYMEINTKRGYYNSEGSDINQDLNYVYAGASITSFENDRIENFDRRIGEQGGFEIVKDKISDEVKDTEKNALELLKAKLPKGGKFNVIFDGVLTDVFVHEALGHSCESDLVMHGESILHDKLNTKIANDIVNIHDDATLKNQWGSFYYDDEGIKAQDTQLIKEGMLTNFMTSRETAKKLDLPISGNARAQDAFSLPIVRMSNTYIEKGKTKFEDMLKELRNGIYLRGSRGGQVDTIKGNFHFSAMDGYVVENGELKQRLTNVSLGGKTLDTLKNINMIANKYDVGFPGFCGKGGQRVPVMGNCPKLLVSDVLIGGN